MVLSALTIDGVAWKLRRARYTGWREEERIARRGRQDELCVPGAPHMGTPHSMVRLGKLPNSGCGVLIVTKKPPPPPEPIKHATINLPRV